MNRKMDGGLKPVSSWDISLQGKGLWHVSKSGNYGYKLKDL